MSSGVNRDIDGWNGPNPAAFLVASPAMRRVMDFVDKIGPTEWTVLIEGETGTGKSALAREIHRRSTRAKGPFVTLDCAALPETLIESELFGYEKGAFTGALHPRAGQFERANGGTLFLDEIANLNLAAQTKLLSALESGSVRRLGGKEVPIDVRIIAASNRNLEEMVREGSFRSDLYHRLFVFRVFIPPLRERLEDIDPLLRHYLKAAFAELGRAAPSVPRDLLGQLERYAWPGNVRELDNLCKRIALLCDGDTIPVEQVLATLTGIGRTAETGTDAREARPTYRVAASAHHLTRCGGPGCLFPCAVEEKCPLAEVERLDSWEDVSLTEISSAAKRVAERMIIRAALERSGGNRAEAARLLKVNYKTLYYKIIDLELENEAVAFRARQACPPRIPAPIGQAGGSPDRAPAA